MSMNNLKKEMDGIIQMLFENTIYENGCLEILQDLESIINYDDNDRNNEDPLSELEFFCFKKGFKTALKLLKEWESSSL